MVKYIIIFFCISILFFTACGEGILTPNKFADYIKNPSNGLRVINKEGEYNIVAQYKPSEYVALINTKGKITASFDGLVENQKDYQHYNLEVYLPQEENELKRFLKNKAISKNDLQLYLSYRMQEDLKIIQGNDTIPCTSYHYESGMGFKPYETFVLAFEEKNIKEDRKLIWDSRILLKSPISIDIKATDINNIPELKR